MPIISVEAQNASLANDYGPTHGAQSPDNLELGIWDDDPRFGGAELPADGGYARVPISHSDFSTPADGKTTILVQLADSTDEWPTPGKWWVIIDADTGDLWDGDALNTPVVVAGAGSFDPMPVTVYHPDALEDE